MRRFDLDTFEGNECPECDSVLMVISMPSETPVKRQCVSCGLITWFLPEVQGHTGEPMHVMTNPRLSFFTFQDWTQ